MTRVEFLAIMVALVAVIFAAMWFAWRGRARRDASVATGTRIPQGALIARFPHVFYISTSPVGEPLTRVAAPALRYRSYGEVEVREDGVVLQLRGEDTVYFDAEQLRGSGLAARRPGKAVERDGLALMRWNSGDRELESAFRLDDAGEQQEFLTAIDRITRPEQRDTHQEGTR